MPTMSGSASTTTRNPRHWQLAILVMATLPKFPTSPSPSPSENEAGELLHGRQPLLSAISGLNSFDHLVGARKQHRRHLQAERVSGLEVGIFSLCDEESAATCCVGAPPHKHPEEFRPVPPIASTIEHIGETRLGARDQSCIRPAIDTQTPWHDIRWLQLSLGTSRSISCAHLQKVAGRFVLLIKTMQ